MLKLLAPITALTMTSLVPLGWAGPVALTDVVAEAEPTLLVNGFRFTEGPLWHNDELYICDLNRGIIYKWTPTADTTDDQWAGSAAAFVAPSGGAAGLVLDETGAIVAAQSSGKISVIDDAGTLTVLADQYNEQPLPGANDLIVRADGKTFFTGPWGEPSGVYRLDQDGTVTLLIPDPLFPNGIALSPDGQTLYYSQYSASKLFAADVDANGDVSNHRLFVDMTGVDAGGAADGMAVDSVGNIFATGPGGVWVIDATGTHIGTIPLNGGASNCAFGGPDGKTLFITSGRSVYRIATLTGVGEPEVCPCDWNRSGILNDDDFFAFLGDFFGGSPADFNVSGSTNDDDFFAFLGCFFGSEAACQ